MDDSKVGEILFHSTSDCIIYENSFIYKNSSRKHSILVRFIARILITIPLRTSNFPGDVRHQLVNLTSLQTFKPPFLSVCLDVELVVYSTRPVGKYGECKCIWLNSIRMT